MKYQCFLVTPKDGANAPTKDGACVAPKGPLWAYIALAPSGQRAPTKY